MYRENAHTTVIGMAGAFGKMKVTSSNLPRRRQFWARAILVVRECQLSWIGCVSTGTDLPSHATEFGFY